ncbi:TPA: 6-phosphofructokinase [bacterium]|nr:6-phosphofructokinase [bacterium]
MRIGVLCGGGDCPGLNPAIRGIYLRGLDFSDEIIGILDGWKGLLEKKTQKLELSDIDEIMGRGGTILGTSRTNPYKKENGGKVCFDNFKELGLDSLIAIGGDDTLGVANKLFSDFNMPVVGVPKTMDNDLSATDWTFGFDTSVTSAIDALEKLRDTGRSHRRIMILEVMGRDTGWVALFTAIGGGADYVLIPEMNVNLEKMCEHLKKVYERKKHALVVVSEGIDLGKEETGSVDEFGHTILQKKGVGKIISDEIEKRTGIETRLAVIGHIQRGGTPTLFDRILGVRTGIKAVDLIHEKKFGRMVAQIGNKIADVSLSEGVGKTKFVDKEWIDLVDTVFK